MPTQHLLFALIILFASTSASAATVETVVGTGEKGFSGDGGPAEQAKLNNVFAVARGPDGYLYLCDTDNHRVRRVSPAGIIETYAGNGAAGHSGDGGPAVEAALNLPYEMAWDRAGNLFVVELGNHCVRRVDARSGRITTIAGTGEAGFAGDGGPAAQAAFNQPHSLAFDAAGDLYVCDVLNHRVRKIHMPTGAISTWSGTGEKKTAADGSPIALSPLHGPRAIAFGPDGVCYLALREGNAILRLDVRADTIHRIAGTGQKGFTGNGGPALQATLSGPKCISLATNGDVYFADTESHTIRYVDAGRGTVELLVGDGQRGDGQRGDGPEGDGQRGDGPEGDGQRGDGPEGDGPEGDGPLRCRLARPHGVFADADGSVFIGDSENHRVRLWRP